MTLRQAYNKARETYPELSKTVCFCQGYHRDEITLRYVDDFTEINWDEMPASMKNKVVDKYDWWVEDNQFCIGTDLKPWPKGE